MKRAKDVAAPFPYEWGSDFLAGVFGDDRFLDLFRAGLVLLELHRERRPALSFGPDHRGVAEHRGERDPRLDDRRGRARRHPRDLAAARIQIPDDVARELIRRDDFHPHDGFQQQGLGFEDTLLERHVTRDLERHFVGVHIVV